MRWLGLEAALRHRSKVMWVAPTHDQNIEQFELVSQAAQGTISKSWSNHRIRFITGGELWFKSIDSKAIRSQGFDLILFDEMAFAPDDKHWAAIRPILTGSGGRFVGATTPQGYNWFKDFWDARLKNNPGDWFFGKYPWSLSSHISQSEIDSAKLDMLPSFFAQEHMAEFIQVSGALFPSAYFDEIFCNRMPESMQWKGISVDLSLGKLDSDYQAIVIGGESDKVLHAECYLDRMPLDALNRKIMDLEQLYRPDWVAFDANGWMEANAANFKRLYQEAGKPLPVIRLIHAKTNKDTRISRLSAWLSRGRIKILDTEHGRRTVHQCKDWPMGKNDDGPDAISQLISAQYNLRS